MHDCGIRQEISLYQTIFFSNCFFKEVTKELDDGSACITVINISTSKIRWGGYAGS